MRKFAIFILLFYINASTGQEPDTMLINGLYVTASMVSLLIIGLYGFCTFDCYRMGRDEENNRQHMRVCVCEHEETKEETRRPSICRLTFASCAFLWCPVPLSAYYCGHLITRCSSRRRQRNALRRLMQRQNLVTGIYSKIFPADVKLLILSYDKDFSNQVHAIDIPYSEEEHLLQ